MLAPIKDRTNPPEASAMSAPTQTFVQVRRLIANRDLERLARIEDQCFEPDRRWSVKDFEVFLSAKDGLASGLVAETWPDGKVVGHCLYKMLPGEIGLVAVAVARGYRRRGVGQLLLKTLSMKLGLGRESRQAIVSEVREGSLGAQLFLRACGYRAVAVEGRRGTAARYVRPCAYEDGEGAICFEYRP